MKGTRIVGMVYGLALDLRGWTGGASRTRSQQVPECGAGIHEAFHARNQRYFRSESKQIAGHEQEPSGQVFKNIQVDSLKKVPAARLLLVMNQGYSRAMGVTCEHCHLKDDFSSDDKHPKRALAIWL